MLKLFADLLMAGEIKIERGTFIALGQKISMVPQFFFVELTKSIVDDTQRTVELYELCKRAMVKSFIPKFEGHYHLTSRKVIDWMKNIGEFGGWGEFEIVDYDEQNMRAIVRITNAPIGSFLKNTTTKPVDHLIRGFMAGAASGVYQRDIDYVETKCVAKGDSYCEFIAKEKSEFLKEDSTLIREQISQVPLDFKNLG